MDAERITELLRAHGNEVTWKSHLAFVERMSRWEPSQILDYHESLMDVLSGDNWVLTSVGRTITLPGGWGEADAGGSAVARSLRQVRASIHSPQVAQGLVGLPLHPWSMDAHERASDPKRERARLIRGMNDEYRHSGGPHNDLFLILRAGPWAYRRATGSLPRGVKPVDIEDAYDAGGSRWWTVRTLIRRDAEAVDLLAVDFAGSAEMACAHVDKYLRTFARKLGAVVAEVRAHPVSAVSSTGAEMEDGLIVYESSAVGPLASRLATDVESSLTSRARDLRVNPLLVETEFWALLETLGGESTALQRDRLADELAKKSTTSIVGFAERLALVLYGLDRPELAGSSGGDVFLYGRASVVARGADAVWSASHNAAPIDVDADEGLGELLLSVAPEAWERKTGHQWDHETFVSYESGSNRAAWGREPLSEGDRGFGVSSTGETVDGLGTTVRYHMSASAEDAREAHDALELTRLRRGYRGIERVTARPGSAAGTDVALAGIIHYVPVVIEA